MIKRILSFLLVPVILASLFGCVKRSSHAEEFLIAARRVDLDTMSVHVVMPSASSVVPFAQEKHYAAELDEEKMSVLISLYSLLQYTIGEESAVENGSKTIKITLKLPDFTRIKSLAHTDILVSGKSAAQVIGEMTANGTVAKNYMTEKTMEVKMVEVDGEFYVSYSERDNAALMEALALSEMFRFFASN